MKSLEPRYGYGTLKYTSYKYNEKGEIEEENIKELTQFNVRVTNKSYKNGKITKERIFYDEEGLMEYHNKIKVDIEKEYDENEKLIRKHVTRQNKHNAMRSETEFDLIKGEIVTKYFDGEKSFATVTETQVGKDKAIVNRERDGDEFVIWDVFNIENKKFNHIRGVYSNSYFSEIFGNENVYEPIRTNYYEYNYSKDGLKNHDYLFATFILSEKYKNNGVQKYIWNTMSKKINKYKSIIIEEKEIIKTFYSIEELKNISPEEDFIEYIFKKNIDVENKIFRKIKDYEITDVEYIKIQKEIINKIGGI